jgi:hypothetical protein
MANEVVCDGFHCPLCGSFSCDPQTTRALLAQKEFDQQQIDVGAASPRDETRQIPPPAKTGIGSQR